MFLKRQIIKRKNFLRLSFIIHIIILNELPDPSTIQVLNGGLDWLDLTL